MNFLFGSEMLPFAALLRLSHVTFKSSFVPFVLYVRMPQAESIKKRPLKAGAFNVKQVHCINSLVICQ